MYLKSLAILAVAAYGSLSATATPTCENKTVIDTKDIISPTGGPTLKMTTYSCSNAVSKREDLSAPSRLSRRADPRCTTSPCWCGLPCGPIACRAETQAIRGNDCATIQQEMLANPNTFTIPLGDIIGFTFESCEYTFAATQGAQYCFTDLGSAAVNIFSVCGTGQQGSCELTNGGLQAFIGQESF
ncbi:hypothetical protein CPC08DRAFT_709248 [Agrocybe pediades]|nr:hypothetical protein CPC08DRAFT_709248 [Agrocybe pediades]